MEGWVRTSQIGERRKLVEEAGLSEGAQNTKAELFWALLLFGMGTGLEWGS